jgi:hypothetical protein
MRDRFKDFLFLIALTAITICGTILLYINIEFLKSAIK